MNEFEIIQHYFTGPIRFDSPHLVTGPGDDCAVVRVPPESELCVSTDTLLAGVHFPDDAAGALVANRALAANLSDLAAMGAEPYGFTLALTLAEYSDSFLSSFSEQLKWLVEEYKLPLIGGNMARGQLSVTINIMGLVPVGTAILRSGAQPGDDIYVTGYLGDAAGGLANVLSGDKNAGSKQMNQRYSQPVPRLLLGQQIRAIATAAIDISDGFTADLGHLCKASRVGASVQLKSLPISDSLIAQFGLESAQRMALQGGDDYELCFTVAENRAHDMAELNAASSLLLTKIGSIGRAPGVEIVDEYGKSVDVIKGYQHF
ncbi:MAG: thiamine-phosphate kinase [Pseudomonadales bacterium]|nr:thiamine-phosphate kinase [Pseudomonadales bacterium]